MAMDAPTRQPTEFEIRRAEIVGQIGEVSLSLPFHSMAIQSNPSGICPPAQRDLKEKEPLPEKGFSARRLHGLG